MNLGLVAFSARCNGAAASESWPAFWPSMKYFWPKGSSTITPFTVFSTDFAFDELNICPVETWKSLNSAQLTAYEGIAERVRRVYLEAHPQKPPMFGVGSLRGAAGGLLGRWFGGNSSGAGSVSNNGNSSTAGAGVHINATNAGSSATAGSSGSATSSNFLGTSGPSLGASSTNNNSAAHQRVNINSAENNNSGPSGVFVNTARGEGGMENLIAGTTTNLTGESISDSLARSTEVRRDVFPASAEGLAPLQPLHCDTASNTATMSRYITEGGRSFPPNSPPTFPVVGGGSLGPPTFGGSATSSSSGASSAICQGLPSSGGALPRVSSAVSGQQNDDIGNIFGPPHGEVSFHSGDGFGYGDRLDYTGS